MFVYLFNNHSKYVFNFLLIQFVKYVVNNKVNYLVARLFVKKN